MVLIASVPDLSIRFILDADTVKRANTFMINNQPPVF